MSLLQAYFSSIPPTVVAAAGGALLAGLPFASAAAASGAYSLAVLKGANVAAFALNCVTVSIPGRIDEEQDQNMRRGRSLNPKKPDATHQSSNSSDNRDETTPLTGSSEETSIYPTARGRTLVSPSGWAFAIWGPIYIGEALFVASQFLPAGGVIDTILPQVTAPFVAANLFQSLWCASFRPNYEDYASYISPFMLAGAAVSLSQVNAVAATSNTTSGVPLWLVVLPMTLHFGWTSAATLVNTSGSVAMEPANSDRLVTAVGHGSAVVATALGVGVTLWQSSPAYGLTLAWALAGCADGMQQRGQNSAVLADDAAAASGNARTAVNVQKKLCWSGALVSALASAYTLFAS